MLVKSIAGGKIILKTIVRGKLMQIKYNQGLIPLAKRLRKEMTAEERHLWYDFLRTHTIRFQRQRVIGSYIADFCCAKARLIIELDGSQHFEEENIKKDNKRTEFFEANGDKVIRIPNNEVNRNFVGVCDYINDELKRALVE